MMLRSMKDEDLYVPRADSTTTLLSRHAGEDEDGNLTMNNGGLVASNFMKEDTLSVHSFSSATSSEWEGEDDDDDDDTYDPTPKPLKLRRRRFEEQAALVEDIVNPSSVGKGDHQQLMVNISSSSSTFSSASSLTSSLSPMLSAQPNFVELKGSPASHVSRMLFQLHSPTDSSDASSAFSSPEPERYRKIKQSHPLTSESTPERPSSSVSRQNNINNFSDNNKTTKNGQPRCFLINGEDFLSLKRTSSHREELRADLVTPLCELGAGGASVVSSTVASWLSAHFSPDTPLAPFVPASPRPPENNVRIFVNDSSLEMSDDDLHSTTSSTMSVFSSSESSQDFFLSRQILATLQMFKINRAELVVALVYLSRLQELFTTMGNLFLVACLLANKYLYEKDLKESRKRRDAVRKNKVPKIRLNYLEVKLLNSLAWNISISEEDFRTQLCLLEQLDFC